ncbi:MAG: FkbM family methyltransferase [Verrucomicrobiota bacterium]
MSFSQTGEDQLILSYLPKENGFFVDVGAFHPTQYSNTFALYLRGWRGINVEPNPNAVALFKQLRPDDLHLQIGVSQSEKPLDYISFNNPLCNTFQSDFAKSVLKFDSEYVVQNVQHQIETMSLCRILDQYFSSAVKFDLLSVDAEGMDLEVLSSNDWTRYRPELVLVEDHDFEIEVPHFSEIYQFMKEKGYVAVGKTLSSVLFHEGIALSQKKKFKVKSTSSLKGIS